MERHRSEFGDVRLSGTTVVGNVDFCGAAIAGQLALTSTKVGKSVLCFSMEGHCPQFGGDTLLSGTTVGNNVNFGGAAVAGDLDLTNTKIGGSILCRPIDGHRPELGGRAFLSGVMVAGDVNFNGAAITCDLAIQNSTQVGGSVFCRPLKEHRPELGGNALLSGVTVGGDVDFRGAAIVRGLSLQNSTKVGGSVLCRPMDGHRPELGDRAFFSGVTVGGNIDLCGAAIAGHLSLLNSTEVGGSVLCFPWRETTGTIMQTEIKREVHLVIIEVKGNVDFSGVVIGDLLHVQQSIVLGFVSLRPALGHRARVGRVLIEKSPLHGNLDCRGTEVAGELAVLDSPVDGVLYLGESLPEDGTKRLLTQVGENKGADLRLMPSVKDVNEIPAEGRDLVIVADVHDVLHFRIFTPGGDRAVDLGQTQLPGKKGDSSLISTAVLTQTTV